jgi:hypothetical protein
MRWLDVRKLFNSHFIFNKAERRKFSTGLSYMLDAIGLQFEARALTPG